MVIVNGCIHGCTHRFTHEDDEWDCRTASRAAATITGAGRSWYHIAGPATLCRHRRTRRPDPRTNVLKPVFEICLRLQGQNADVRRTLGAGRYIPERLAAESGAYPLWDLPPEIINLGCRVFSGRRHDCHFRARCTRTLYPQKAKKLDCAFPPKDGGW